MNKTASIRTRKSLIRIPGSVWMLFTIWFGTLLFMLLQGGKLSAIIFMFTCAICLYLILGRWSGIRHAEGSRELLNAAGNGMLIAGQHMQLKVVFHVPGFWPLPYVHVKERLTRKNGEDVVQTGTIVLGWSRRGELVYNTPSLRRGTYRFQRTELTTADIFGIMEHKGETSMPDFVTVMPETVDLRQWTQFHQILKGTQQRTLSSHANRETTQINGVREYIYGDRLSRIHWNATAKTGTWKSKEFEREALPKTIVVLDRKQRAYFNINQYELAVSVAASLIRNGEEQRLPMGLLSAGHDAELYHAGTSGSHFDAMMTHLVDADADGFEPLERGLQKHVKSFVRGSMFIIVSPQRGHDMTEAIGWLKRHGMNGCHILVDAPGNTLRQDSEEWMKKLRNMNIIGVNVTNLHALPLALEGAVAYG